MNSSSAYCLLLLSLSLSLSIQPPTSRSLIRFSLWMNVWNQLICLTVCYPLAFSLVRSSRYNIINKKLEWLSALLSLSLSLSYTLKAPFRIMLVVGWEIYVSIDCLFRLQTQAHSQHFIWLSTSRLLCLFFTYGNNSSISWVCLLNNKLITFLSW